MLALVLAVFPFAAGFGLARNFTQRIDHFSTSQETYQQRSTAFLMVDTNAMAFRFFFSDTTSAKPLSKVQAIRFL